MNDVIYRHEAIDAIKKEIEMNNLALESTTLMYSTRENLRQRNGQAREDIAAIEILTSAQTWIPCSEKLPDKPFACLVTVMDYEPMTCEEFENILPYFVGYDGEQWNDYEGNECPFEILAWQKLPEPYKT